MNIETIRRNAPKGSDLYRIENGVVEYAVSHTYIDWNTGKKVKMLPCGWNWL